MRERVFIQRKNVYSNGEGSKKKIPLFFIQNNIKSYKNAKCMFTKKRKDSIIEL